MRLQRYADAGDARAGGTRRPHPPVQAPLYPHEAGGGTQQSKLELFRPITLKQGQTVH